MHPGGIVNYKFRDPFVPLSPEQAEYRRLVLKQVDTDPASFNMLWWERNQKTYIDLGYTEEQAAACGTTRCLAGWAEYFANGEIGDSHWSDQDHAQAGIDILGLTEEEYYGAARPGAVGLFFTMDGAGVARRFREIVEKSCGL